MRITMTETRPGSPDGTRKQTYQAGESYDLPESLATSFVNAGWASAGERKRPETISVTSSPFAMAGNSGTAPILPGHNPDTPPITNVTPLSEDFPGRELLEAAGIVTVEQLADKTRDELIALKGIGATTADRILAAIAALNGPGQES